MLLNINGMEMLGVGYKIKEKGLTLIEALVSTVIVGIGFVAVFQMVNYSVQSIDVSGERTKGNYLVSMVAEDVMGSAISSIDITDPNDASKTIKQKFYEYLVKTSSDATGGKGNSWSQMSCSSGSSFQGNNVIKRKIDKWEDRFSTKMFKCRGANEKKYLKVYDICASGCRYENKQVNDKMYIGKMEVLINFGEKKKFLYFPIHNDIQN